MRPFFPHLVLTIPRFRNLCTDLQRTAFFDYQTSSDFDAFGSITISHDLELQFSRFRSQAVRN